MVLYEFALGSISKIQRESIYPLIYNYFSPALNYEAFFISNGYFHINNVWSYNENEKSFENYINYLLAGEY